MEKNIQQITSKKKLPTQKKLELNSYKKNKLEYLKKLLYSPSVRFTSSRRWRWPSSIQLLQIIQNQLRPFLRYMIQNQIPLVIL